MTLFAVQLYKKKVSKSNSGKQSIYGKYSTVCYYKLKFLLLSLSILKYKQISIKLS